jgi:hypothetical protein
MKRSRSQKKKGTDDAILKQYITYHSLSSRMRSGKQTNGAYVENEIIAAVAMQNNIIIKVAAISSEQLQVLTPTGTFSRLDADDVQRSPFMLWCNGGHYQAIVPLSHVEVLDTALSTFRFISGNMLSCKDIRTE